MAARRLQAVPPGASGRKVKPKPPGSVTEAIASGGLREILVATRNRIAKTVDDATCPPRDLAALTRRLDDIVEKLAALDLAAERETAEGGDVADEAFDSSAI